MRRCHFFLLPLLRLLVLELNLSEVSDSVLNAEKRVRVGKKRIYFSKNSSYLCMKSSER